ncbi:MAG: hypothetical protein WCF17_12860 [Terracidiphilus sp.]
MIPEQKTTRVPGQYRFRIRAFESDILFETTCLETHSILERYAFPSLPRIGAADGQPDVLIRLDSAADGFQLSVDDVVVAVAHQAVSLVPDLIRVLDDAVIQSLTTLHAVHAGAVLWRGRILLLPGATHAGKSSLVAELLRRGATYFSDEYAIIDAHGRVYPYARPLLVRDGRSEQIPMLPHECNAVAGDAPSPVGWIFSLEYHPASTWSVAEVPQSMALLTLLQNTPHSLAESPEMVSAFQNAVAEASCYAGSRTEAVDAVDRILQLVDSIAG